MAPSTSRRWAAAPRVARPRIVTARPAGSFPIAIERARGAWDGLIAAGYSETAAAAILDSALGLWGDTAATMGGDAPADETG